MHLHLRRPTRRPAPRGRTFAFIMLVLAALCLIGAIIGGLYGKKSLGTVTTAIETVKTRFESGENFITVITPGESKIKSEGGAILLLASSSDTIDGKSFTYPPSGGVSISVVDSNGAPVSYNPFQGNQPPIETDGGKKLFLLGFAETPSAGEYTVKATGGETAVRAIALPQTEIEAIMKGGIGVVAGGAGLICGGGGFLLFGIIGGIMLLFGRKPTPAT